MCQKRTSRNPLVTKNGIFPAVHTKGDFNGYKSHSGNIGA